MEVRAQQVIFGIAEAIAAHNLLQYVRTNTDEEKIRMAAGAGMAGLGYVFGPDLESRLRHLKDGELSEHTKQQMVYAAGGIMLGSITGYVVGPKLHDQLAIAPGMQQTLLEAQEQKSADKERPGGLLTIASAGWLGYSLFFDGKTKEEQQRHLWGLGAGVVGYMYGPEMLRKLGSLMVPASAHDDAVRIYTTGSAVLGGIAGGIIGWKKGPALFGGA
jgi:hypothetical protein